MASAKATFVRDFIGSMEGTLASTRACCCYGALAGEAIKRFFTCRGQGATRLADACLGSQCAAWPKPQVDQLLAAGVFIEVDEQLVMATRTNIGT